LPPTGSGYGGKIAHTIVIANHPLRGFARQGNIAGAPEGRKSFAEALLKHQGAFCNLTFSNSSREGLL
jgi:hypothetical protein